MFGDNILKKRAEFSIRGAIFLPVDITFLIHEICTKDKGGSCTQTYTSNCRYLLIKKIPIGVINCLLISLSSLRYPLCSPCRRSQCVYRSSSSDINRWCIVVQRFLSFFQIYLRGLTRVSDTRPISHARNITLVIRSVSLNANAGINISERNRTVYVISGLCRYA